MAFARFLIVASSFIALSCLLFDGAEGSCCSSGTPGGYCWNKFISSISYTNPLIDLAIRQFDSSRPIGAKVIGKFYFLAVDPDAFSDHKREHEHNISLLQDKEVFRVYQEQTVYDHTGRSLSDLYTVMIADCPSNTASPAPQITIYKQGSGGQGVCLTDTVTVKFPSVQLLQVNTPITTKVCSSLSPLGTTSNVMQGCNTPFTSYTYTDASGSHTVTGFGYQMFTDTTPTTANNCPPFTNTFVTEYSPALNVDGVVLESVTVSEAFYGTPTYSSSGTYANTFPSSLTNCARPATVCPTAAEIDPHKKPHHPGHHHHDHEHHHGHHHHDHEHHHGHHHHDHEDHHGKHKKKSPNDL